MQDALVVHGAEAAHELRHVCLDVCDAEDAARAVLDALVHALEVVLGVLEHHEHLIAGAHSLATCRGSILHMDPAAAGGSAGHISSGFGNWRR